MSGLQLTPLLASFANVEAPFILANLQTPPLQKTKENTSKIHECLPSLTQLACNHSPAIISSIGGLKHAMRHSLEQIVHKIIVAAP